MPDHACLTPFTSSPADGLPLSGVRILSLALNLPGPAALMRCAAMGAQCSKLEPPSAQPGPAGADPMALYSPQAYSDMHQGIAVWQAQLKTEDGQAALHKALDSADMDNGRADIRISLVGMRNHLGTYASPATSRGARG